MISVTPGGGWEEERGEVVVEGGNVRGSQWGGQESRGGEGRGQEERSGGEKVRGEVVGERGVAWRRRVEP